MQRDLLPLISNLAFLDEVYARYLEDPTSVDASFRTLFEKGYLPDTIAQVNGRPATNGTNGYAHAAATSTIPMAVVVPAHVAPVTDTAKAGGVVSLVNAFRARGHFEANLDPLGMMKRDPHPELDFRAHGFTDADVDALVPSGGFPGPAMIPLRELIARLRATYCGTIGVEYTYLIDPAKKTWLAERMEPNLNTAAIDRDTQVVMLEKLAQAETFERFLHTKFPIGTKRFSLEGAETLIPLLDVALEQAGRLEVDDVVVGMAHRGRLTVLVATMGKKPRDVFAEFEDLDPETVLGAGDVKYHLGYSTDHVTRGGKKLHMSLSFNPSHLEAVDPVVVGRVRAKQRRRNDEAHAKVMGVLIHGDAAFAGQGLVPETLNLSEIHGYRTGGTLHVIVNNQIGFTTSPAESRSTPYATDVAKMLHCPIFHVNGEDVDAVAHVVKLAMDFRQTFHTDVVIDMLCFRRYGHNEGDEPSFTQPLLYKRIKEKEAPFGVYSKSLIDRNVLTRADVDAMVARITAELDVELKAAKAHGKRPTIEALGGVWKEFMGGPDAGVPDVDTGVAKAKLVTLAERIVAVPPSFTLHPTVAKIFRERLAMAKGEKPLDWGTAETLAYATLLSAGTLVRLTGQDTCRGTFSHRHAAVFDYQTGEEYQPLAHLAADQGECRIYDSPLSEAAVMGFEFGFSLDYPDGLVIWEAQFGDFVNGAQVILDQFVSSSEDKWKRLSGLTLFLPHGYEGQGPEHSSARFERFLQLCAEDNLQVCYPTTPAQIYHVLRRQVVRRWRKPLVVMTPKSLLRAGSGAISTLDELATGRFQRVLQDPTPPPADGVKRIFVCTGKIYYDLAKSREERGDKSTAIVRLEQLYPWRDDDALRAFAAYPKAKEVVWIQEEPSNMGALFFVEPRLRRLIGKKSFRSVSRVESASPATGSHKAHGIEQKALLEDAFK